MIQKFIDKIINRFKNFFDKDKDKMETDPEEGWTWIMLLFFAGSFLSISFYYFIFSKEFVYFGGENDEVNILPPELSVEKITKENLKKMMAIWETKQKKFDDYAATKPDFDSLR